MRISPIITCTFVTLTLTIGIGTSGGIAQSPRLNWYRGNTHTHTLNSDGDSTPEAVARRFREIGYQFVVITDHDYVTDVAPLNASMGATEQFLLVLGEEVTQWVSDPSRKRSRINEKIGAPAHVVSLFSPNFVAPIGPRNGPGAKGANSPADMPYGETLRKNVEAIQAAGGIAQIAHPNLLWAGRPEDLTHVPDGTLIEIWNGGGRLRGGVPNNLGGDDGTGIIKPSAEGYWDWALSRGKIMWGAAADDSHTYQLTSLNDRNLYNDADPGWSWIVVRAASLTAENLKTAIASGNFYASTGVALEDILATDDGFSVKIEPETQPLPNWPVPGYSTGFIGQDGKTLSTVTGLQATYRFTGNERYVRAVVTDSNGKKAWTQPVFRDARKSRSPYRQMLQ